MTPYCTCGHSYWSHSVWLEASERSCERVGCRCDEYVLEDSKEVPADAQ